MALVLTCRGWGVTASLYRHYPYLVRVDYNYDRGAHWATSVAVQVVDN